MIRGRAAGLDASDQPGTYWIETLGCPKNLVDSAKLAGFVEQAGYRAGAAIPRRPT